jgi:MFS family permease
VKPLRSDEGALPLLGGAQAWLVWLIAVAFVVYYFSFQTGYATVNAAVQKDVGLSIAQVGTIAAIYTWVFALCQFLSGALLDRMGARPILLPSILLVTIGIFIFANSRSFEMLLLSQGLIAVGACTGFVGAGYVGGKWFGMAKFSFMFGLVQFAASLFSAFGQNFLNWMISFMSWPLMFNYFGCAGIVLLVVALFYLRDPAPVTTPKGQSFGTFLRGLLQALWKVGSLPHVWITSAFGALSFGTMLALGVVWAPKLLMVRGLSANLANLAASSIWLGLAVGCFIAPAASDWLRRRKLPVIIGLSIQVLALAMLLYVKPVRPEVEIALCFLFGLGSSAHMLAFSSTADVVEPANIGTSAAIVNGTMFLVGGIMISRPGVRIGRGLEGGLSSGSLELAQYAALPLLIALCIALIIAIVMRETYPVPRKL